MGDGRLTWDAVPYAICYVITKDGNVVGFTTDTNFEADAEGEYTVQAANEQGGLSEAGVPTTATAISELSATGNDTAVSVEFYSIDGKRLNAPANGITIVRTRYADGTIKSAKIVK